MSGAPLRACRNESNEERTESNPDRCTSGLGRRALWHPVKLRTNRREDREFEINAIRKQLGDGRRELGSAHKRYRIVARHNTDIAAATGVFTFGIWAILTLGLVAIRQAAIARA